MRHSLICVHPDGTIEGVVSLTDIFSFLLNSSAPAAESRIAALKKDYAQFEAAEAEAAALSEKRALFGEEMLKQRTFLLEHGQLNDGQESDITMTDMQDEGEVGISHTRPYGGLSSSVTSSPHAIRPSAPTDAVPVDMDFLVE